jgi:YD repeat-containing protein
VETERVEFDARGLPWRTYKFGKLQQTLTYGADGTLATVADANNNVTSLSQWKRGMPQLVSFADQTVQKAWVNDDGTLAWVADERSARTCYDYDNMGRVRRITFPSERTTETCEAYSAATPDAWAQREVVFEAVGADEYGIGAGHWRKIESAGNARTETYYDALWRPLLTRQYDASNVAATQRFTRSQYDAYGRTTFKSYPASDSTALSGVWTEYDVLGRPTSVSQDSEQGLLTTRIDYGPGLSRTTTDPRNKVTIERFQVFDTPTFDVPIQVDAPEGTRTVIVRNSLGTPLHIQRGSQN